MPHTFVLRNATVPGHASPVDIAVEAGRIAAIAPGIASDAPSVEAGGRLVCGGLIETHIHLDKAGIIGRCSLCSGTLAEAVAETSRAKADFTAEDVYARARAVVEKAIGHGTTRLRTFVEIDPRAGFRSFEAILTLRRDLGHLIAIEICAFAQEGLTNDPGTEEMLDQALASGADLVGGCPYTDPDSAEHVRRIFALAEKHGVAVDFHLDFDLNPEGSNLPVVIAETLARGYQGRVSVGHVTKLAAMSPERIDDLGRQLAAAGIALTILPATDLFLTGRIAPAARLAELGVVTSLSTNNVLNPFTPFGDASLLRMANLYATVAHLGLTADLEAVFAMITGNAARILGLPGEGLRVGDPADLVLFDAASTAEAVAANAPAMAGWKAGVPTFTRAAPQLFV